MDGTIPLPPGSDDLSGYLFAVICTVMSLASFFVLLRLYTRSVILKKFRRDDWSLVVAWILVLALGSCLAASTRIGGLGRHYHTLDEATRVIFSQTMWASTWLYQLCVTALKTTFCLHYLRIFPLGYVRPCTWTLLIFSLLWGLSAAGVCVSFCQPIESIWNHSIPRTCIFSVIRIVVLERRIQEPDRTWAYVDLAMWSVVEISCATMCACIPTLKPLVAKLSANTKAILSMMPWGTGTKPETSASMEFEDSDLSVGTLCTRDVEGRSDMGAV